MTTKHDAERCVAFVLNFKRRSSNQQLECKHANSPHIHLSKTTGRGSLSSNACLAMVSSKYNAKLYSSVFYSGLFRSATLYNCSGLG